MHEDYTLLMSQVLDKEATPAETASLDEHLGKCPACAATWNRWRLLDHQLRLAPMLAAPRSLAPAILSRLESRHKQFHKRWIGSWLLLMWGLIALAAVGAVGLAIAWGLSHPLEVSIALSLAAQLFGGLARFLGGFRLLLGSMGGTALSAMLGLYLAATGCLLLLWLRVISRRPSITLARAAAGNSSRLGGV